MVVKEWWGQFDKDQAVAVHRLTNMLLEVGVLVACRFRIFGGGPTHCGRRHECNYACSMRIHLTGMFW